MNRKPPTPRQVQVVYTRLSDISYGFMRFIARTPLASIGHDDSKTKTTTNNNLSINECGDCKVATSLKASAPVYPLTRQAADKLYKNLMNTHHYNHATGALEPKRFGAMGCPHISWPNDKAENANLVNQKAKEAYDLYANHVLGHYSDATWKDPAAIEAAANRYHGGIL